MATNVGSLAWDASINLEQFQRDARQMISITNSITDSQNKQSQGIEDFAKKAAQAAAGFLSIQAATNFVKSMVEVRGAFQQIEVAFGTMLKSKDAADKLMAQAVQLAAVTPFTLQEVASGAKQLLAYGFAAKDVTKQLETLGNIASGVGSDLNGIVYLYGTLKASGRVTQIDINQFAGRGIPIYQALADVMKINVDQVRSYVSAGKIGFPQVEAAFNSLTGAGGQFFNLMQQQSLTLTGQLSNLEDAWDRMLNALGKQNEGLFAGAIGGAIDLINNYQKIIDIIEILIITYGSYRAALILQAATTTIASLAIGAEGFAFSVLRNGILETIGAIELYQGATVAAVATTAAITAVLASLALVTYSLVQYQNAEDIAQQAVNKSMDAGQRAADAEDGKIQALVDTIKSHTVSIIDKKQAYDDLQKEAPAYLKSFTLEEIAAGKASGAIALFEGNIRHLIETESKYASYKDLGKKIDELNQKGIDAVGTFDKLAEKVKILFSGDYFSRAFNGTLDDKIVDNRIKVNKDAQANLTLDPLVKAKANEEERKRNLEEAAKKIKDDAIKIFNDLLAKDTGTGSKSSAVVNFDQLIKVAPNKDSLDKLQKALTDTYENLAPGDAQKDAIKKKIQQVDKFIAAEYDTSVKAQVKAANDRAKFLDELSKTEAKATGKALDQNGEAINAIHTKYEELRKKAATLKLGNGVTQRIDNLEKTETGNVKYEQDTKLLQQNLEKQKQLQIEYEADIEKFGIDAAKNKYAGLLVAGKSYYQQLADEQYKLYKIPDQDRTGNENERLKIVNNLFLEEAKRERDADDARLATALEAAKTYNAARLEIDLQYYKNKAAIEKNADIVDKSGALAQLDKKRHQDQSDLALANIQQLASYKELFDGLHKLSVQKTNEDIAAILKTADEQRKAGQLTEEDYLRLKKSLSDVQAKLKELLPEKLKAIGGAFSSLSSSFEGIDKGISKAVGKAGELISSLADIKSGFDTLNNKDASSADKFSAGLGIAGTFVGLFTKFLIDPINEAAAAKVSNIQAGTALQIKAADAVSKALERQLALTKQLYGPERLSAYLKQLDDIKKAQNDTSSLLSSKLAIAPNVTQISAELLKAIQDSNAGTPSRFVDLQPFIDAGGVIKLGTQSLEEYQKLLDSGKLDENTSNLVKTMIDLNNQFIDTTNALHAELLGIDLSGIEDSIVSLFQNASSSVEDFGKNFEDIMQKSILNSFKRNALEKQLQGFYDDFYKYSLSDNNLSTGEIALLKAEYDKVITDAQKQFDDLSKATGIDLTTSGDSNTASNLTNAVKGITTVQADLLAGQFGGQRLATLEGNNIATNNGLSLYAIQNIGSQSLEQLIKIEANTKRGADNTDGLLSAVKEGNKALASIDKKAGAASATASGNGLPG